MSYRTLLMTEADGVATITLNRPERRNAFGDGMGDELAEAYRHCDGDDDVRVIVLTGTPPAFCAGADLTAGAETFAGTGEGFSAAGISTPAFALGKPVIAAVNGHAIGIGLTLALQADIRFMARDAKYGVVQARRGVVGDAYSHWVLPRIVGLSTAAEILMTGATFDGLAAERWGLCGRTLPADEVLPAALALATEIATWSAPGSVLATKQMLWASFESSAADMEQYETAWHQILMARENAREGVRAFLEGREPRWAPLTADETAAAKAGSLRARHPASPPSPRISDHDDA